MINFSEYNLRPWHYLALFQSKGRLFRSKKCQLKNDPPGGALYKKAAMALSSPMKPPCKTVTRYNNPEAGSALDHYEL